MRRGTSDRLSRYARALLSRSAWLRPLLHEAPLWRWSRRAVATGAAVGVCMGLLIPLGQIPASAFVAVILRGNLPIAMLSTLITNPITVVPAYYGMYTVGSWLLGITALEPASGIGLQGLLGEAGAALLIGVPVSALLMATLTYWLVSLCWRLRVRYRRPDFFRRARVLVKHRRLTALPREKRG